MTIIKKSPSGANVDISAGSSAFAPIGKNFWLDPASAVVPVDGSIRAPFTTYAPFWALLVGLTGSAQLNLPGTAPAVDGNIPNLGTNPSVVLQGQSADRTILNLVSVAGQTAQPVLDFRDVTVTSLQFTAGGNIPIRATNAVLNGVASAGTLTSSVKLVNCTIGNVLGFDNSDVQMLGGQVTTKLRLNTGTLRDVALLGEIEIVTTLTFVGVSFGPGSTIRVNSSQTITMDLFSWASMKAAGTTFPDTTPTIVLRPQVSVMADVNNPAPFVTGPGISTVINCGQPAPFPSVKNGKVIAGFNPPSPSNPAFVIQSAETDGIGDVIIVVRNTSLTTTNTLAAPSFTIVYEPRILP